MSDTASSSVGLRGDGPVRPSPAPTNRDRVASIVIPIVIVSGSLVLMVDLRDGLEAAVANLPAWLPVGYAFAAGMVASVNSPWLLDASKPTSPTTWAPKKRATTISRPPSVRGKPRHWASWPQRDS
mgnify:CR=1 FL=1